ncbi:MAG TPA: universal stress protein [Gemmatimonadaceae bacterium]
MTAVEMITREIDETEVLATRPGVKSILVATDGSDTAIAALSAAKLICGKVSADVHVVSVVEPMPIMLPTPDGMLLPPDFEKRREDAQRVLVSEQMKQFDPQNEWTLDVRLGRVSEAIARVAREQKVDLIIIGTNKHGLFGRIMGEDTATEIARLSDIPLLVASPMKRLPHRVIVGMDLNPDGMQCTPKVLSILVENPSISCVHVQPRSEWMGIDWAELDTEYEVAMKDRFSCFETEMRAFDLRPELVVLHGDAAHELTDFAEYSRAELIVVGVKRRVGRTRAIGGRIAGRVIRQAACSVLVVPNIVPKETRLTVVPDVTDVVRDSRLWSSTLRDFTARNAGRIVTLEVDDPDFGALVEAYNYPLLGVDFDHRDQSITITLGDTQGLDRHLTRTISKPQGVSVLSVNGRDTALSIAHGGGQTLLTL